MKKEFDTFSEELEVLSPNIYKKMKTFLFSTDHSEWGKYNLQVSWSSPELRMSINPHSIILDTKYRRIINNKSIDRFRDVIEVFKHEIELRSETKDIKRLFRSNKNGLRVKIIGLDRFDKYEDVENLGFIINNIFSTFFV